MPLAFYASSSHILCVLHFIILACMSLVMDSSFCDTMASRSLTSITHQKSDVRDIIIARQCYAKCDEQLPNNHRFDNSNDNAVISRYKVEFANCEEKCRFDAKKLPRQGQCPVMRKAIFQSMLPTPRFNELSCVDSCSYDIDCPEIKKCCKISSLSCGNQYVCMTPIDLRNVPEIPKILKYKLPRGHKVEIAIATPLNSTCLYHVESRSHIGLFFSPRKLGPWHWQPVEKIAEILDTHFKRIDIAFNLKPGRWYQVRVAAINSNGFAGYSEPSKAFSLVNRPKPPKAPADLKVVSTTVDGNYFNVKIVWCPSKSNLPVEKYKIIWSLYVKSKGDSLISNESVVKNSHQYTIKNLLPDSSYYIQVQAMTAIGKRRLKSDKTSILYNTTTIEKSTKALLPYEGLKCSNGHNDNRHFPEKVTPNFKQMEKDYIKNVDKARFASNNFSQPYEVHFLMNRKLGMIVRISGFHPQKESYSSNNNIGNLRSQCHSFAVHYNEIPLHKNCRSLNDGILTVYNILIEFYFRVYELCPKETNCEQREYSAIRAKKNALEFSKLKYSTTYMLKTLQSHEEKNYNANRPFIFTTPKCEKFSKKYPKMQIQC